MRLRTSDVISWYGVGFAGFDLNNRDQVVDAWRQLHHAAQAVSEVGKSWGEPADDDSHSAFIYDEMADALLCDADGGSAELDLESLAIGLRCAQTHEYVALPIEGKTVSELTRWTRAQAERLFGSAHQEAQPAPDLPAHPVADDGVPIALSGAASDVVSLYAYTRGMLERIEAWALPMEVVTEHDATPRLWPHHFDLASLLVLGRDEAGAMSKTVGVGLAAPDDIGPLGYWYVSVWQRDGGAARALRELPFGRWHRDGASPMAVLPVDEIVGIDELDPTGDNPVKRCAAAEFIASAINASLDVLGA